MNYDYMDKLKKKYDFDIEENPENKKIIYFNFKDGKRYKKQIPSFMELHEIVTDSDTPETDLFRRGIETLYSENDKSPKIDEDYIEANKKVGHMWSVIMRRLLWRFVTEM